MHRWKPETVKDNQKDRKTSQSLQIRPGKTKAGRETGPKSKAESAADARATEPHHGETGTAVVDKPAPKVQSSKPADSKPAGDQKTGRSAAPAAERPQRDGVRRHDARARTAKPQYQGGRPQGEKGQYQGGRAGSGYKQGGRQLDIPMPELTAAQKEESVSQRSEIRREFSNKDIDKGARKSRGRKVEGDRGKPNRRSSPPISGFMKRKAFRRSFPRFHIR